MTPPLPDPDIAFHEGVMAQLAGDDAGAERCYRRALAAAPDHAGALQHLAIVEVALGRAAEAAETLSRALTRLPEEATLWLTLASAHHALARHEDAVAACERALALRSPYPEAENLLGATLLALDRPEAAIVHFRRAVDATLDDAEAQGNLGVALLALDRAAEAVGHCEAALATRPASAAALRNLGAVLLSLRREEEALARFDAAAALDPADADAHHGSAVAAARLGRLPEAVAAIDRAIAARPGEPKYYRTRGWFGFAPAHVAALNALAADAADLPPAARTDLHFALGKAYGDAGDAARSIGHWIAGNALKRQEIPYDEAATLAAFARIRETFTPALIASRAGAGHRSRRPIFVVGFPRSGSTLIEQILSGHPQCFGAGEVQDFALAVEELSRSRGLPYPELAAALAGPELRALGAAYDERLAAHAPAAPRVIDKTPGNFALVGLIHLALPEARIIHARRDPLDACLSCFAALFERGQAFTYDLGELGRYHAAYRRLMRHWHAVLPAGTVLDVEYEALVADLEGEARRMLAYLGLDWDEACLAFNAAGRPVRTASAVQVRQPLYRSSVGRAAAYRPYLQALVDGLGDEG